MLQFLHNWLVLEHYLSGSKTELPSAAEASPLSLRYECMQRLLTLWIQDPYRQQATGHQAPNTVEVETEGGTEEETEEEAEEEAEDESEEETREDEGQEQEQEAQEQEQEQEQEAGDVNDNLAPATPLQRRVASPGKLLHSPRPATQPDADAIQELERDVKALCPWLDTLALHEVSSLATAHGNPKQAGRILQLVVQCTSPEFAFWSRGADILQYDFWRQYLEDTKISAAEQLQFQSLTHAALELHGEMARTMNKYRVLALRVGNTWAGYVSENKGASKKRKHANATAKSVLDTGTVGHARTLAKERVQSDIAATFSPVQQEHIHGMLMTYIDDGKHLRYLCEELGYWILATLPCTNAKPLLVPTAQVFRSRIKVIEPAE